MSTPREEQIKLMEDWIEAQLLAERTARVAAATYDPEFKSLLESYRTLAAATADRAFALIERKIRQRVNTMHEESATPFGECVDRVREQHLALAHEVFDLKRFAAQMERGELEEELEKMVREERSE